MQCPKCRSDNPNGARFCNQCGTPLEPVAAAERPLPSSDDIVAKIQRYLPQGLTRKILSQRDHIEGERRQVTVMFCDMVGFTPLVERIGPEAAYTIMGQIYEILIRQVNDCEGTINEMTGDGIMALFGAPIALEEAPQRALWAAHAIHREIAGFNHKQPELGPIRMRIGIHSGPVVVGTLGSDLRVEFKAVGDTVNLASRMEQSAEPGTTYVTHEVYLKARGMFEFESVGKKIIKGWADSVPVYKVLPGKKEMHRPRLGSERVIFSEMVGRKSKLDKLELQVMKLINGAGAIVNIIGEAGIGKSRLLAELKRREALRRVTLLEGRAISMGRNLSFHPIVDLLKQWAQIGVEDDTVEAFIKLETAVGHVFGEVPADVLPFVATLMGLHLPVPYTERIRGIEGEALEKLIRKSMRELLERISLAVPLIIVIDDLHWADRSSIELLEYLFRLAEHERLLFINVFRPDYADTGQRIMEGLKANPRLHVLNLVLEPLDERNSATLVVNMLNIRGAHHPVVDKIIDRAGGNPYFIEEVVRSFIDQGAVIVRNGKFEVTPKLKDMTFPDTINDILMARIDRLEEGTRDLIKVAAVIGRSFFYRVLSEVANTVRRLDERLSNLKDAQLIQERRRMEELEYLFIHALAQEAAYASILPEKRKLIHLQVAQTIEKVFAEKLHAFYGMLAYHYSRAENLDKTEEALINAGEEALNSSASSEALHYYMEALRLYRKKSGVNADAAKIALLEKNIALAFFNHGLYEEAVGYFDKALHFYWGRLPKNKILLSARFLAAFLNFMVAIYLPFLKFRSPTTPEDIHTLDIFHKKSKALGIINPGRFFVESIFLSDEVTRRNLSDSSLWLEMFIETSCLFSFTGLSFNLSERILDSSYKRIQPGQVKVCLIFDFMKTLHQYLKGDWRQISHYDPDLVNKNLSLGEVFIASQHLYWHGCPSIYMGNFDLARDIVEELSKITEVYDNDFSILLNHMLKSKLQIECRQLDGAFREIEKAIDFAKKKGFRITLLDFYSSQGRVLTLKNDLEGAAESFRIADEICSTVNATPIQMSIYYRSKVEYLLRCVEKYKMDDNQRAANELIRQTDKDSRKLIRITTKAAQHRTEAYRLRGIYYGLINKPRRGIKWLEKAIREGEKIGARLELARSCFETGRRMKALPGGFDPSHSQADEYLAKAKALFSEMGLHRDLEILRNLSDN